MSYKDIIGWFNYEELYDEIVDSAPDSSTIVEVGCAFGRSLAYLSRRALDSKKSLRIWGIDSFATTRDYWQEPEVKALFGPGDSHFDVFMRGMQKHAPEELTNVQVIKSSSVEAANLFQDNSCHAVFIDGDHSYPAVYADLLAWRHKISSSGIFAGHDIGLPGVHTAVQQVIQTYSVRVRRTSRDGSNDLILTGPASDCWIRT